MRSLDELLATSAWARELAPDQLQRTRSAILVRDLQPGGYACRKGNQANAWLGVVDGLVKAVSLSWSGKSVTFAAIPAGSWIGEGSVLKREVLRYDVIALRQSRVAMMPHRTFFWLLDNSIAFNRFILVQLNERLGQFMASFEHDRLLDPEARIARALANMLHPLLYPGHGRRVHLSQDELSHIIGASRQRVSQALQVLQEAELIEVDYGMITVLDIDGLQNYRSEAVNS